MNRPNKFCRCACCLRDLLPEDSIIVCTVKTCKKSYHTDICAGTMPSKNEMKTWMCPKCKCDAKKGGDNSSTPIKVDMPSTSDESNITHRQKQNLPTSNMSHAETTLNKHRELPSSAKVPTSKMLPAETTLNKHRELPSSAKVMASTSAKENVISLTELQDITTEIRSLRQDVAYFKNNFEDMLADSVAKLESRMEEVLTAITKTDDAVAKCVAENNFLKQKISSLEEKLHAQTQYCLRNELEIVGLPETPNENVHHLVLVAAKKVGVDMKDEDIDWIERVGPKRRNSLQAKSGQSTTQPTISFSRPIVVRFTRRTLRDKVLKSAKTRRPILANDIDCNIKDPSLKVYFNERLTRENRILFRNTRACASEAGFKYCWTNNCNIYVRKKEGSPAVHIRNESDLMDRFGSSANDEAAKP